MKRKNFPHRKAQRRKAAILRAAIKGRSGKGRHLPSTGIFARDCKAGEA